MGYIKFKKVIIEGFMSINSTEIELNDRGLVFVKGINEFEPLSKSNGSGKSAIFESLIWCLTGSTSRNSNNIVNRFLEKGALVKLEFSIDETNYIVTRTEKHYKLGTSLTILKDEEDISGNTITKSKSILKDELNQLNYDTLTSIIVLSQGLPGRLSSLKPSQRKSRLEELSSMDSYIKDLELRLSKANKLLDEDKLNLMKIISNEEGQVAANKASINRLNEKIESIKAQSVNIIDESTYNNYKEKIVNANNYLEKVEKHKFDKLTELSNLKVDANNLLQTITNYKNKVNDLMMKLSNLSTGGNCPTCHRPMTDIAVVEQLQLDYNTQIADITNKLAELGPKYFTTNNSVTELETELSSYEPQIASTKQDIKAMQLKVSEYDSSSLNIATSVLVDDINNLQQKISVSQSEIHAKQQELNKVLANLDKSAYVKKSISRKFRSFLLQGVIDYINTKCNDYSQVLFKEQGVVSLVIEGNNINIKLGDQYFEELSGGESRRVDIVLQLVQRDLARNESGFASNILVLDEILDYLDSSGVESVIDLIESKSTDCESILIVSHKEDVKIPYDDIITVVKRSDRLSYVI